MTQTQLPLSSLADWPLIKQRWQAWWHQEIVDRPVIQITAPRDGARPAQGLDVDPVTQWTDAAYMIHRTEEIIRTTWHGGDAIPWCWNPISAGHALYFGCTPHFHPDTMWVEPAPDGPDGYPALDGWRDSAAWRWARESTAAFARASHGRFYVQPFWGNHAPDILAMVRGAERFYEDFALDPAWVKRAVEEMTGIIAEVEAELWRLAYAEHTGVEGSLNCMGCWSPARTLAFDCDISCNISTAAFRSLIVPSLLRSMQPFDHNLYHLDGANALHHLDLLLSLPEIHAIQWVPGAGHEPILQWIPLIQRIQSKGKSVIAYCTPDEVFPLLREVRPAGLCIVTHCSTETSARRLLESMPR